MHSIKTNGVAVVMGMSAMWDGHEYEVIAASESPPESRRIFKMG